jgi:hypothetical protein
MQTEPLYHVCDNYKSASVETHSSVNKSSAKIKNGISHAVYVLRKTYKETVYIVVQLTYRDTFFL